jgi:hypothetical protein
MADNLRWLSSLLASRAGMMYCIGVELLFVLDNAFLSECNYEDGAL